MNLPDIINAGFEFGAGFAVLHHCFKLYEHKQARGVSIQAVIFFTAWGLWNLFYYPHLGQFWSFAGGIFITLVNMAYVSMLWVYDHRPSQSDVDQLVRDADLASPGYQLWAKHEKAAKARAELRDRRMLP